MRLLPPTFLAHIGFRFRVLAAFPSNVSGRRSYNSRPGVTWSKENEMVNRAKTDNQASQASQAGCLAAACPSSTPAPWIAGYQAFGRTRPKFRVSNVLGLRHALNRLSNVNA
ncbi:hypothetical protein F4808DRAFT_249491 [Astrocystis sublimbata]|nr:hypothetical protein F4808DRAFT_249491 [Astrocystis sublimbata]